MIITLLRRGDGLASGRFWLSSVVKNLQLGLASAGQPVSADGKFGSGTEGAVKAFQRAERTNDTGIVDKATWAALARHLDRTIGPLQREIKRLLRGFDGDLDWVHEREGHRGTAYWPGTNSGVTLDPGVDLGQVDWTTTGKLYDALLTSDQKGAVTRVLGLKGQNAKAALDADPILRSIHVSKEDAERIMPHAAQSYWNQIVEGFPLLSTPDSLPSVQTVFLSLAYNRGPQNSDLIQLKAPLESKDWSDVANRIGAMQQDHTSEGIRVRRRMEADLIRAELEYVNS